jgi:hypothetical protein
VKYGILFLASLTCLVGCDPGSMHKDVFVANHTNEKISIYIDGYRYYPDVPAGARKKLDNQATMGGACGVEAKIAGTSEVIWSKSYYGDEISSSSSENGLDIEVPKSARKRTGK